MQVQRPRRYGSPEPWSSLITRKRELQAAVVVAAEGEEETGATLVGVAAWAAAWLGALAVMSGASCCTLGDMVTGVSGSPTLFSVSSDELLSTTSSGP